MFLFFFSFFSRQPEVVPPKEPTLYELVESGEFETVFDALQKNDKNDLNYSDKDNEISILTHAIKCAMVSSKDKFYDFIDIIEQLLFWGANVNFENFDKTVPLYWVFSGDPDRIKERRMLLNLLVNYEADVNAFWVEGVPIVFQAARFGNLELLKIFLDAGAKIEEFGDNGQSILHWARSTEIVSFLLSKLPGGMVLAKDSNGDMAIDLVIKEWDSIKDKKKDLKKRIMLICIAKSLFSVMFHYFDYSIEYAKGLEKNNNSDNFEWFFRIKKKIGSCPE